MLEVYEKSVTELRNEMIELGIKVEQAVDNAWKALEQKDIELANRIYNGDDEIDTMVRDCMKKDLTISMMQGPVAADYRALMATLKILSDLERIADHCADISHYVIHLEKTHLIIKLLRSIIDNVAPGTVIITETNVPHKDNIAYFGEGDDEAHMVYQFSLPPLVLHAVQKQNVEALCAWAQNLTLPSSNTTWFNFLASHDGIGLNPLRGLLPETKY